MAIKPPAEANLGALCRANVSAEQNKARKSSIFRGGYGSRHAGTWKVWRPQGKWQIEPNQESASVFNYQRSNVDVTR
jgi:hypothetical protein